METVDQVRVLLSLYETLVRRRGGNAAAACAPFEVWLHQQASLPTPPSPHMVSVGALLTSPGAVLRTRHEPRGASQGAAMPYSA